MKLQNTNLDDQTVKVSTIFFSGYLNLTEK